MGAQEAHGNGFGLRGVERFERIRHAPGIGGRMVSPEAPVRSSISRTHRRGTCGSGATASRLNRLSFCSGPSSRRSRSPRITSSVTRALRHLSSALSAMV